MSLSDLLRVGTFVAAAAFAPVAVSVSGGCSGGGNPSGYSDTELAAIIRKELRIPKIADFQAALGRNAPSNELVRMAEEGEEFYGRMSGFMNSYTLTQQMSDIEWWMDRMQENANAIKAEPSNRDDPDTMRRVESALAFYELARLAKTWNYLPQLKAIYDHLTEDASSIGSVFWFATAHLQRGETHYILPSMHIQDIRIAQEGESVARGAYAALPQPLRDGLTGWLGKYGPPVFCFDRKGVPALKSVAEQQIFGRVFLEGYGLSPVHSSPL